MFKRHTISLLVHFYHHQYLAGVVVPLMLFNSKSIWRQDRRSTTSINAHALTLSKGAEGGAVTEGSQIEVSRLVNAWLAETLKNYKVPENVIDNYREGKHNSRSALTCAKQSVLNPGR